MTNFNLEFIHEDKYGVALQVAKTFTSKSSLRQILQYVYHDKEGTLFATDSHRAIEINNIHGFKENMLIHPTSYQLASGNYPEINKTIKDSLGENIITLDKEQIKIWLQVHKSLNQLLKKGYRGLSHVTLEIGDCVTVSVNDENSTVIELPCAESNVIKKSHTINYKPDYMRDCLEAHVKMNSDYIRFNTKGNMRPLVLDNEKNVKSLVLPVRTF